jgi:hypothetical protein
MKFKHLFSFGVWRFIFIVVTEATLAQSSGSRHFKLKIVPLKLLTLRKYYVYYQGATNRRFSEMNGVPSAVKGW